MTSPFKRVICVSCFVLLLFGMSIQMAVADAFYYNMKDELTWSLKDWASCSNEGYSREILSDSINGVVLGFDLQSNRIFIIGENKSRQTEACSWNCRGQNYDNSFAVKYLIVTDGIVDEISADHPITFMYRYAIGDWNTVYLEDEEEAFKLNDILTGHYQPEETPIPETDAVEDYHDCITHEIVAMGDDAIDNLWDAKVPIMTISDFLKEYNKVRSDYIWSAPKLRNPTSIDSSKAHYPDRKDIGISFYTNKSWKKDSPEKIFNHINIYLTNENLENAKATVAVFDTFKDITLIDRLKDFYDKYDCYHKDYTAVVKIGDNYFVTYHEMVLAGRYYVINIIKAEE